jgi:Fe2+ or Zn2+ uptake regulation protein
LIYEAVRELNVHATAEQVYEHVSKDHPTISKATVYRNLSQMAEANELLNIGSFAGAVHYDHNLGRHYHFVCDCCGLVFDVPGHFPELTERAAALEGFEVKDHSLSFSGLCPDCKAKTSA